MGLQNATGRRLGVAGTYDNGADLTLTGLGR